jgi:nucleoid-associated protein YgaU
MINSKSRYVNSLLADATNQDGVAVIAVTPSRAVTYTFTYVFYVTNGADRIDTIADAYYGDPTLWWKIGDANPEIMKWDDINPGTVLRIPNA